MLYWKGWGAKKSSKRCGIFFIGDDNVVRGEKVNVLPDLEHVAVYPKRGAGDEIDEPLVIGRVKVLQVDHDGIALPKMVCYLHSLIIDLRFYVYNCGLAQNIPRALLYFYFFPIRNS